MRAALVALAACAPELADSSSIVDEPRLIAVAAEPPEVAPGGEVTTTALWVDPTGALAGAPLEWAFCTARKRIAEPGPVAAACLVDASADLVVYGTGDAATGMLPTVGCSQFGPDAPAPLPGESAGRPADPDGTGGFYQPIRVRTDAGFALGEARLRCGLPGATPPQAFEFAERYVPNTNPAIERVTLDGAELAGATVAAGSTVELAVHWPVCDAAPCTGSEPYLWFDPQARALAMRREAMRVSWLATAGAFATGHGGRGEADAGLAFADGRWTAPATPGVVHLFVVLRDDRGGTTWATHRIAVE